MGVSVQNERGGLVSCAARIVGGSEPEEPVVDLVITDHEKAMPAILKMEEAAELGYALLEAAKLCGAVVNDLEKRRGEVVEVKDIRKLFVRR